MKFSSCTKAEQAMAESIQFYDYEFINIKGGLAPSEIWSKAALNPSYSATGLFCLFVGEPYNFRGDFLFPPAFFI